ncbi:MAG: glucose-6-phosphate isomerase [Deltaproteobacteria bacterium]|jgi:glucose-6-phosphate isomerase|nr:glucose-6-phosphate isomerase [Deltaproteobacteria bacterium]
MIISLNYTNMMADAVGAEYGIHETDLLALRARAKTIHEEICNRRQHGEYAFFDLPFNQSMVEEVLQLSDEMSGRFKNIVVLGIGGSALGTTAVFRALRPLTHNLLTEEDRHGLPRLFVLDNVDPDGFAAHLAICDPAQTCFLVISKSGATVETTCQFLVAKQWLQQAVGEEYREHFVLITDPEKGSLRPLAVQQGYRACDIPPGVGGRFSVLTPVSLLPLALAGVDIQALLRGAADFAPHLCHGSLESNPAYLNAALQYLAYQKGLRTSVLMPYSDRLRDMADWFRQLWAESLGKKYSCDGQVVHVGPTPVNALGTTDQHSQVQLYMEGPFDKVVTFITVDHFDQNLDVLPGAPSPEMAYLEGHSMAELIRMEQLATAVALTKNHRPNCMISLPNVSPETVGALIYLFEVQTLFAGALFGVNPLDQPGVEEGKQFTYALMGRSGFEEKGQEYARIQSRLAPRVLNCQ